jgi:hypothetical protein
MGEVAGIALLVGAAAVVGVTVGRMPRPTGPEGHWARRHLLDERPDPNRLRHAGPRGTAFRRRADEPYDVARIGRPAQPHPAARLLTRRRWPAGGRAPAAAGPSGRPEPATPHPAQRPDARRRPTAGNPPRADQTQGTDADFLGLRRARQDRPARGHRLRGPFGGQDAGLVSGPEPRDWRHPHAAACAGSGADLWRVAERGDADHAATGRLPRGRACGAWRLHAGDPLQPGAGPGLPGPAEPGHQRPDARRRGATRLGRGERRPGIWPQWWAADRRTRW